MAEKNLLKLAKGNSKNVKPIAKKPAENKIKQKAITQADERDARAKKKVEELLSDVQLTPIIEEKLVVAEDTSGSNVSVEWLEEQVSLLSESNKNLKAEIAVAKGDYEKIFIENQQLKSGNFSTLDNTGIKVIELFNELQNNHIKLGTDPNTGIGNFRIYCPGFLNRLITFFPFLENEKRY